MRGILRGGWRRSAVSHREPERAVSGSESRDARRQPSDREAWGEKRPQGIGWLRRCPPRPGSTAKSAWKRWTERSTSLSSDSLSVSPLAVINETPPSWKESKTKGTSHLLAHILWRFIRAGPRPFPRPCRHWRSVWLPSFLMKTSRIHLWEIPSVINTSPHYLCGALKSDRHSFVPTIERPILKEGEEQWGI